MCHIIRSSVGRPIPGTELRIVSPDHPTRTVADGTQGLILARGPGIMSGYADNDTATAAAFVGGGWFDTGDLGWRAPEGVRGSNMAGCIVLTGRLMCRVSQSEVVFDVAAERGLSRSCCT
jgi:long-chain acyl-CoA synthetase